MTWVNEVSVVFLNLFRCESSWAEPGSEGALHIIFLTVVLGALPTLCLCDILVILRLCCEPVVMVFYFGVAVLCVSFLYFVRILWYFSPCWKIWENLSGCWKLISVVLMIFLCVFVCFLSFIPWCNVIGSDLFFCKSNYESKCGCEIHYFSFFFFVSLLQLLCFPLIFCLTVSHWICVVYNHPPHFNMSPSLLYNPDNLWISLSHSWH